jgi:hypothetical protein
MKLRNATWIIILGFIIFGANNVLGFMCGAIIPSRGFDGEQAAFTDTTAKDLVFIGTVTEIYPVSAARSSRNWAVVAHIDKVVSGEFSGTTFTFAIHSPARAGLRVGQTYTIKATWTAAGYIVNEAQWRKGRGRSNNDVQRKLMLTGGET